MDRRRLLSGSGLWLRRRWLSLGSNGNRVLLTYEQLVHFLFGAFRAVCRRLTSFAHPCTRLGAAIQRTKGSTMQRKLGLTIVAR
jgi:hypothetical protein